MERISSSTGLAAAGALKIKKAAHGRKVSSFIGGDAWLGGAFRDRSVYFKEHREKARASSSSSSLSMGSAFDALGSSREIELHSLVSSSSSTSTTTSSGASAVMTGTDELRINVPPAWLRLVDESHYDLERIKTKSAPPPPIPHKPLLAFFISFHFNSISLNLN
jgi:hypothetical protein